MQQSYEVEFPVILQNINLSALC